MSQSAITITTANEKIPINPAKPDGSMLPVAVKPVVFIINTPTPLATMMKQHRKISKPHTIKPHYEKKGKTKIHPIRGDKKICIV
jgi:hypothetical protein